MCWFIAKCYLEFKESGQPQEPLDHQFLAKELNITEDHTTASV
jgi:hypothetical protein